MFAFLMEFEDLVKTYNRHSATLVAKGKAAYYCDFKSQLGPLLMLCEDSKLNWWRLSPQLSIQGKKKQPTIDITLLLLM